MGASARAGQHRRRIDHRRKGRQMTDIAQEEQTAARGPVALGANDGDVYWFFGTLVTIKAGSEQ
jgi:hypothetical protein